MNRHDKRAHTRHTVRDDVTLIIPGSSKKERCVLDNVSMGGAMFYTELELPVGRDVELHIPSLEDEPEIVIEAKILRSSPGQHSKTYAYACLIKNTVNV